jgi:2-hydroxychromene-2-carboxylate isomerase
MSGIEFWFEFGSTYSYPTALRIERTVRAAGLEVTWRPFLLGPIFKEQGWHDSPFNLYPAKGRYMWRDLERICADLAIPLRQPTTFPRNSLLAARLACWFQAERWIPEFIRQVYLANFGRDRDIAEAKELLSILDGLNQPPTLLSVAESSEAKAKLRAQTAHAQVLGIFGAPSFVVEQELFWGNDRLEAAIAWAQRKGKSTG